MTYKIGVDFGITYSKIAYLDEKGDLQIFGYPEVNKKCVPTAVAYQRIGDTQVLSLGDSARLGVVHTPGVHYCENFKMLLPLQGQEEWRDQGWSADESPAAVMRDYCRHLLREDQQSFEHQVGPIESLVVSAPEVWQRTPNNRGAATLQRILEDELTLPLDHVQGELACAAAYFAYQYQKVERRPMSGNLLVCDMGGGTFDVALCQIAGAQVEVLDCGGNGYQGPGLAGVTFDHRAVTAAYVVAHGANPALESLEFLSALRAFEAVKIQEHNDVITLLKLRSARPEFADTPLYNFPKAYRLTYEQLQEAFRPIELGIVEVLSRFLDRISRRNWTIDRVAIVGGFGQFPFVRQAILQHLGLGDHDPLVDATIIHSDVRAFAVAYGAALIANGLIQPVESYPHTIGMFAHRKEGGVPVETFFPLLQAGKIPARPAEPYFMQDSTGTPCIVHVAKQMSARLPVFIRLRTTGEPFIMQTPEVEYPAPGRYHIGLGIDRARLVSLVFKPVDIGEARVYTLGSLSSDLRIEDQA